MNKINTAREKGKEFPTQRTFFFLKRVNASVDEPMLPGCDSLPGLALEQPPTEGASLFNLKEPQIIMCTIYPPKLKKTNL
jgi:hypothetical protein